MDLLSKDYGKKRYLKKGKILICFCGKEFYKRPSQIKEKNFCSKECSQKGKRGKPKIGKWGNCNKCDKKKWIFPRDFKRKYVFCSKKCFKGFNFGGKTELKCKECGKKYKVFNGQIKHHGSSFCSIKCQRKFQKMKYLTTKRKNKTKNSALKKLLWTIFSQYIRQRDKGICFTCGKIDEWKNMDAGHYIPKTAGLALYFDEINVNCQCTYCNRFMHGNLSQYALLLQRKYGKNILEKLEKKRKKIIKISFIEYQDLIEKYKNKILEIKNTKNGN